MSRSDLEKLPYKRRLRASKAASGGGYKGGSRMRLATRNFNPIAGSPEVDINLDLPDLRPRSRELARNSSPATSAININLTNVIGTGLSVHPRVHRDVLKDAFGLSDEDLEAWEQRTRRRFNLWAESKFCDAEETNNFYELQALAFLSMLESGDVFAPLLQVQRPGWPFKLAVQLMEADRVSNPNWMPDSKGMSGGVEVGERGQPLFYHYTDTHPGAINRGVLTWKKMRVRGERSGRLNVLHVFESRRPGQKRGVPYLAPVIEQLKQLEDYTDAELRAAVVSAAFAVFIKMDPEAFQDLFSDDETQKSYLNAAMKWSGDIDTGKAVNLLPGEDVSDASPGRPNSEFDPFVTAMMRQIGMSLEIPYEVLVNHFQSSYSAARAALLAAWRVFRKRRGFMVSKFCQPSYETWLAEDIAAGNTRATGFFADPMIRAAWCGSKWIGDAPGAIDEAKAVKAAKDRVELGISTLDDESILHDGEPWESKHKQRKKERRLQAESDAELAELMQAEEGDSDAGESEGSGDSAGADIKQEVDAYGVGVRAGAITQQPEDEEHFRTRAGLPEMSAEVRSAWEDDGKVRRQITLKSGEAFAAEQDAAAEAADDGQEGVSEPGSEDGNGTDGENGGGDADE